MAFAGAISGLFSCGKARRSQALERARDANGLDYAGTGGEELSSLANSSAPDQLGVTPPRDTNAQNISKGNRALSVELLPRESGDLFPFATFSESQNNEISTPPITPAIVRASTGSNHGHISERQEERPSESRKTDDTVNKARSGTHIERRILVTTFAEPHVPEAKPGVQAENGSTIYKDAPLVRETRSDTAPPSQSLELESFRPQSIKVAEDHSPSPSSSSSDDLPTSMPQPTVPEPILPESIVPEPIVIEPTVPGSAVPESTLPESTLPESTLPESTLPESTLPESTLPESTVPESTGPESTVPESVVPESIVPESIVPEPKATLPVHSFSEEGSRTSSAERPARAPCTFLSLPQRVRFMIYEFMTEAAPIRMCRHDSSPAHSDHPKAHASARHFYNATQVCHQLRKEFLPIYEQRTTYIIDLWTQRSNLTTIESLHGQIAMDIDAACFDMQPIDLLPLIRYIARSGRTNCRFASIEGVVFRSIESTVEQLNKLLPSKTHNGRWNTAIHGPMKRIDLHLFPHDDIRQYYRFHGADPMLRIVYPSSAIENWMKQPCRSGAEYETYLEKVGLQDFGMHVVVGHASRRTTNEGQMPLNWRLSYVDSRLSLDQAVRISGTFTR